MPSIEVRKLSSTFRGLRPLTDVTSSHQRLARLKVSCDKTALQQPELNSPSYLEI